MYVPDAFRVTDTEMLWQFIADHPFAALCSNGPDGFPVITQVPMTSYPAEQRLVCHLAAQNDHWKLFEHGPQPVKVMFSGPHTFVSVNDYAVPEANVPTWAYVTVMAKCTGQILDPVGRAKSIIELIEQFGERVEPKNIGPKLQGIVGISLDVKELIGKWKVGQNRKDEDRLSAAYNLMKRKTDNDQAIAELYLSPPNANNN